MDAAHAMVNKGFKKAGYNYVNSDDCWSNHNGRDKHTHQLRPNMTKFPDGIKGLADKIHNMGVSKLKGKGITRTVLEPCGISQRPRDPDIRSSKCLRYMLMRLPIYIR